MDTERSEGVKSRKILSRGFIAQDCAPSALLWNEVPRYHPEVEQRQERLTGPSTHLTCHIALPFQAG